MEDCREELRTYRDMAELTGDVFFRYIPAEDRISMYGGGIGISKYGGGYPSGIDNNSMGSVLKKRITEAMTHRSMDFCDSYITFEDVRGTERVYRLTARLIYDEYNEVEAVAGRLENIRREGNESVYGGNGIFGDDLCCGALDKESFYKRLDSKFSKYEGRTCGLLIISMGEEGNLFEQKINLIQTINRIYPYDVITAVLDHDETGVFYYGNDIKEGFISRIAELENGIKEKNPDIVIQGGMYYGAVSPGTVYRFVYRTRMAYLAAKCKDEGSIVIYDELISDDNGEYEAQSEKFEPDTEIVMSLLEILNAGGPPEKIISMLFEMLGRKYGIDCISVHEYDEASGKTALMGQWYDVSNPDVTDKIMRKPFESTAGFVWGDDDFLVIDRLDEYEGHNDIIIKMKAVGIRSTLIGRYSAPGPLGGWVSYDRHRASGKWTEKEIGACKMTTAFLSAYFINLKKYNDMLKKEEENKTHDSVTGLLKKDIFIREMQKYAEANQDKSLALVAVDFDNFTRINDIYGRDTGDEILRKFADELRNLEGRYIMGSRTNADNYLVLVNQYDDRGNRLSAAMMDTNNRKFLDFCSNRCPQVSLIINSGVVLLPKHIDSALTYIEKAVIAKNKARQDGTIKCVFDY